MIIDKIGNMFEDRRKKEQKVIKDRRKEDNKTRGETKTTNKNQK